MKQITELLKERKQRGYEIAKQGKIVQKNGVWLVPSATNPRRVYGVRLTLEGGVCNCEDYAKRQIRCKHLFSVQFTTEKILNQDGTTTITTTKRVTIPQDWKAYDLATTQQKELYLKLLNDLCNTIDEPAYVFGRPKMPLRDMVFSSALKVFTTFSLRRFTTDIKEAQAKGYVQKTPDYSTVAKYMEDAELTPILKGLITASSLPLKAVERNFSIDSSGFATSRFGRWYDHKYGKEMDKRVWYKAHLVNGNSTHIITAVEITDAYEADSNMLEQLVSETSKNFDIKEFSADKAYSSRDNLATINKLGAVPYIPFKAGTTGKPKGNDHIWRKMFNYFVYNQAEFLEHYHKRSNVETVFHMIKSKFGSQIRSKNPTACINEVLLKALCHNICCLIQESFELGIDAKFLGC